MAQVPEAPLAEDHPGIHQAHTFGDAVRTATLRDKECDGAPNSERP